jgi:hypothetical protein
MVLPDDLCYSANLMNGTKPLSHVTFFLKHLKRIAVVSFFIATITVLSLLTAIQFPAVQRGFLNTGFRMLENKLGFRVHARSVAVNWFKGTVAVEDIRITPYPMNTPARITVKSVFLDIGIRDFFQGRTSIQSMVVVDPEFLLERHPDGSLQWPWSLQSSSPDTSFEPGQNDLLSRLRIETARLENGRFHMFQRDMASSPLEMDGISVTLSTESLLSDLRAEAGIRAARWRNPATGESIGLTQPLALRLRSDIKPVYLFLESEIEGFPLTINGHFSPFTEAMEYALKLSGTGPVDAILRAFNVNAFAVPELEFTADVSSDGMLFPNISVALQSPGSQIGPTRFDNVTVTATLSHNTFDADLVAHTGPGHALVTVQTDAFPSFDSWETAIDFRRFPLDTIGPWIPETLDLRGFIEGSIHARGSVGNWCDSSASGSLTIIRSPAQHATVNTAAVYHLRPEGHMDIDLRNCILTVSRFDLTDTSLQANLSGNWNIPANTWSANISILSDDIEPWTAMAGITAGGKAEISGRFAVPEPGGDIAGTGTIEIRDAFYENHRIPVAGISVAIVDSKLSADIRRLVFDDLTLSGTASGDLDMRTGKARKLQLLIDSLRWRDMPEQSLDVSWEKTRRGQTARLTTGDSSVRAEFSLSDNRGWHGYCELDAFQLNTIAPLLPEPLDTLSGTLTCRLDLDHAGEKPDVTVYLEHISVELLQRTIQNAAPGHITWRDHLLSITPLVLTGDDGSRLALNSTWHTDNTGESSLQGELSIQDLRSWPIPGGPGNLSGAVHANMIFRNLSGTPVPEGMISATGLTFGSLEIADLTARLKPPAQPGGLSVDLVLDRFRPGTGDLMPGISTSGILHAAPGYHDPETLDITAELDMFTVTLPNLTYANDGPVTLAFRDNTIVVDSFRLTGPDTACDAAGTIALTDESPDPGQITVTIQAALKPLTDLGPDTGIFSGRFDTNLYLTGPAISPLITGRAQLNNISWDNPALPGPIQRVNGTIVMTDDSIDFEDMSCIFGGGRMDLTGGIRRNGFELGAFDLALRARDLDLDITPDLHVRAMGDTRIQGIWPDIAVNGLIRITEALYTPEFDVIDLLANLARPRVIIEEDTPESDTLDGIPMDLTVMAQDNIRIENSHMNLSLTARLQITGTTSVPGVLGSVTLGKGVIDLLLHEFDITSGTLNFTQPFEIDPSIEISAETVVQGETVRFRITGRASRPNLLLSSDSGKSHAEIMTLLLGRNAVTGDSELSSMALDYAKQAAAHAAAHAIGTRTDLIIIPFPAKLENENLLVGVGRQFGDNWKVMYYFGEKSEEGDVIELEYQVNPKTDLRMRQNQDGSISGGFRYRETFN